MKNLLILLAILPSFLFAQADFTEATMNDFDQKLKANPVETVKQYTHKDFTFINGNGSRVGYNELVGYYTIYKETARNLTDIKITQVNQTVNITGKVEQVWHPINDPNKVSKYTGMFTYVYVYDGESWKIISAQHTDIKGIKEQEETAIRKVIQDETVAYYAGNAETLLAQWSDRPNTEYQNQYIKQFIGSPYAKGETMLKLQDVMRKFVKKQEANVKEDDFEIRLKGDMAWVTFTQVVNQNDKVMQHQRQTRILEKINGDWKIVFVSGLDLK
jgi:Domain of unknown function (DUF4440)